MAGMLFVWRLGEDQGLRDPLEGDDEGLLTVLMLWLSGPPANGDV